MSDLVFYIGPFLGCKALLKMMASILTALNSFGVEGSGNNVAKKSSKYFSSKFDHFLKRERERENIVT
jgi:hypothetical protein